MPSPVPPPAALPTSLVPLPMRLVAATIALGLAAFVGAGLVFAGITDTCGMGMLLARMPWNRPGADPAACSVPVTEGVR